MSSPIGHAFFGMILVKLSVEEKKVPPFPMMAAVAMAPDVDMLCALWLEPENYGLVHGHTTHSAGAALVAGLVLSLLAKREKGKASLTWFMAGVIAYFSHILLDIPYYPNGIYLLEPFFGFQINGYLSFMPTLHRHLCIIEGLLYPLNWLTVLFDTLLYGGLCLLICLKGNRKVFSSMFRYKNLENKKITFQEE